MAETDGLTQAEREELEQLRAEKAEREEAAAKAAERAELEQLRAEKAKAEQSAAAQAQAQQQAAQDAADLERARKLMEPDEDDLKMPTGQKIVIAAVFGVAVVFVLLSIFR